MPEETIRNNRSAKELLARKASAGDCPREELLARLRNEIREDVLSRVDLNRQVADEEIHVLIQEAVIRAGRSWSIPIEERLVLERDVFRTLRGMDVLEEFMEDDEITDIKLIKIGDEENISVSQLMPTFVGGVAFQFTYKEGNDTFTKAGLLYHDGEMVRCSVKGGFTTNEPRFALDGKICFVRNIEGMYYDSNDRVGYRLLAAYLGTINNLSSPVVKMPTQTMKVTYTLTNIEEE